MTKRSPIQVFILTVVTFGIYSWYWSVKTKTEMNKMGENIPTAWLWLIPVVGWYWWTWKYSEGVERVTKGKLSTVLAFILMVLLNGIGQVIIQHYFNESIDEVQPAVEPQPVQDFGPQEISQVHTSGDIVPTDASAGVAQSQNSADKPIDNMPL